MPPTRLADGTRHPISRESVGLGPRSGSSPEGGVSAAPQPGRPGTLPRRTLPRRTLLAGALTLALPAIARAAPPAPPLLSLLVGSPPGRGADPSARAFAPFLERHLRQARVAVLNRPGDSGLTALRLLADAEPNGLTLGWVATPTLPARIIDHDAGHLLPRLHLVGAVQKTPIALVSPPGTSLASVADLLRRAGQDSAALPLGTPPAGSAAHLAALRLQALSGTRLDIVAFPSAAAARQAAQQGHVAAAALPLTDAIDALRDGSLAGLGIAASRPNRSLPDIAPLHASGIDLRAIILRGLAVPAGTDPTRLATLQAALSRLAADPEFIAAGEESGFLPTILPGPAWTTHLHEDLATLATLWNTTPWPSPSAG